MTVVTIRAAIQLSHQDFSGLLVPFISILTDERRAPQKATSFETLDAINSNQLNNTLNAIGEGLISDTDADGKAINVAVNIQQVIIESAENTGEHKILSRRHFLNYLVAVAAGATVVSLPRAEGEKEPQVYVVSVSQDSYLNVREKPDDFDSLIIGRLYPRQKVAVLAESRDSYQIDCADVEKFEHEIEKECWVSKKFLELIAA